MDTRKLFYEDAYTKRFKATVLRCERAGDGWDVELNATAFFPEEGGQAADTGTLGGVRVLDAHEKDGAILHRTDGPLEPGQTVEGALDWPERFRKMQNHTGEHIVSGLIHGTYGLENVGFHLGPDGCTVDFSGELTRDQLDEIEWRANETVWRDVAVTARFPSVPELAAMEYRSKLALTRDVRIVTVEGVDVCACCAPHVSSTGQIGAVKILDCMRHRGGVRLWMKSGADALADHRSRYEAAAAISGLLNVPQGDVAAGVERLLEQRDGLKRELSDLRRQMAAEKAAALPETEGHLAVFFDGDEDALRALANAGMEKCGGVCAVFSGADGAWRFVMASAHVDMRRFIKENGPAIQARGGGQERMVSGRSAASRAEIEAFFHASP